MSPKRLGRALLKSREAFREWTPSLSVAVAIVLLLCVFNGASVAYAGGEVTSEVSGTVTVDNPEHPPDWVCEDSSTATYHNCDAPETIEKPLRPAARSATGAVTIAASVAPLAWVLLFAGLFVVGSGRIGEKDGAVVGAFRDGVCIAAVAAVPGILRYLVRPFAVERSLTDWTHPSSLDGVRTAATEVLFPDGPIWLAVVVLSAIWTAYVIYGGMYASSERGDVFAWMSAVVAFVTTAGSVILANSGRFEALFGLGLLLVFAGVIGLLASYTYISISKSFELIGFGGGEQVEPKPWYVAIHRLAALGLLGLGFVLMDGIALV